MSLQNHRRSTGLHRSLVCALTAMAVAVSACTSMHKVPVVRSADGQPHWQVKAGDTIRVTLRDGGTAMVTVQRVTPEAIIASDGTKFDLAEITAMERRGVSGGKTVGLVGGIGALAFVLALAATAVFLSALLGGGTPDQ